MAIQAWRDGVRTLAGCVRACWRYCRACRYVSFSAKINDCSWYRALFISHTLFAHVIHIAHAIHIAQRRPRYRVCDMNNLGAKDDANLGLWTVEVVPPVGESAPIKGEDS